MWKADEMQDDIEELIIRLTSSSSSSGSSDYNQPSTSRENISSSEESVLTMEGILELQSDFKNSQ